MRSCQHEPGEESALAPQATAFIQRRADGERRLPPEARDSQRKLEIQDLSLNPHFYKCPQPRSQGPTSFQQCPSLEWETC